MNLFSKIYHGVSCIVVVFVPSLTFSMSSMFPHPCSSIIQTLHTASTLEKSPTRLDIWTRRYYKEKMLWEGDGCNLNPSKGHLSLLLEEMEYSVDSQIK